MTTPPSHRSPNTARPTPWPQVARQLRAQGLDLSHQEVDRCAKYLAGLTLESLGVVFSRARELQDWLKCVPGAGQRVVFPFVSSMMPSPLFSVFFCFVCV